VAGSGKSYIVEIASTIATGDICAVASMASTEEELEKRLSSLIMRGAPIISLDNANRDIDDGVLLCQMLTQGRVSLRILGRSEQPEYDCRSTVFATGNNIAVVGDLTRRTLICNLDRGEERPELHNFMRKPVEMIKADRGKYVAAGLTIIRAYLAAGAPAVYEPLASYDQWSRLVRAPLIWLGEQDAVASMDEARDNDPERAAIREFLPYAAEKYGVGSYFRAGDVFRDSNDNEELKEILAPVASDKGNLTAQSVGYWLRSIKGRVEDGHRLQAKKGKRTLQYFVETR
jgi:putative DNA primase/helicase